MALTYLVDTSVLTRLARPEVRTALDHVDGHLTRPSIVDLEIGFSARNAAEWDALHDALGALAPIDVEAHHLRRAAQVQRLLAAAGRRGRAVPDLIIAACAEDRDLVVLHYDADYDHIAHVTHQRTEWIVPPASID